MRLRDRRRTSSAARSPSGTCPSSPRRCRSAQWSRCRRCTGEEVRRAGAGGRASSTVTASSTRAAPAASAAPEQARHSLVVGHHRHALQQRHRHVGVVGEAPRHAARAGHRHDHRRAKSVPLRALFTSLTEVSSSATAAVGDQSRTPEPQPLYITLSQPNQLSVDHQRRQDERSSAPPGRGPFPQPSARPLRQQEKEVMFCRTLSRAHVGTRAPGPLPAHFLRVKHETFERARCPYKANYSDLKYLARPAAASALAVVTLIHRYDMWLFGGGKEEPEVSHV